MQIVTLGLLSTSPDEGQRWSLSISSSASWRKIPRLSPSTLTQPPARPMPHILTVEDSSIQAEMLRRVLVAAGYQVSLGRERAEGLRLAQALKPDLVFSDITMPVMDGFVRA